MSSSQTPTKLLEAVHIGLSTETSAKEGVAKAPLTAEQLKQIELNRLKGTTKPIHPMLYLVSFSKGSST